MIKIAILDMYDKHENQGMKCIDSLLKVWSNKNNIEYEKDIFNIRANEIPYINYDIFISTGGPGSPIITNSDWENNYKSLITSIKKYNDENMDKKYVLFICHSFQLACQIFNVGEVKKNTNTIFGIYPLKKNSNKFLDGLNDTFYVVDSRDYRIETELKNSNIFKDESLMFIQFNDYMIGTQFHPEASPEGMMIYLNREDKKKIIIENYSEEKWIEMVNNVKEIQKTYNTFLNNFLEKSTK